MSQYTTDGARWEAIQIRDPAADRAFVYCVRTTQIYCRPICKARLARRANVVFHDSARDAQKAGFRACKRCKPEQLGNMPDEAAVRKIRAFIAEHEGGTGRGDARLGSLKQMAESTGLSRWHFHRVFKKVIGVTPREWVSGIQGRESEASPATDMDLDFDFTAVDWNVFGGLNELQSTVDGLRTYGTSENNENASLLFDFPIVVYTIMRASFGILLLAYQQDKVCMIKQATTESDLMAALYDAFPVFLYQHAFYDTTKDEPSSKLGRHATALVKLLDQPLSDML